ncbi:MAG TPA: hypothetical protein VFU63_00870 [Ktedonobacterales bacterium]|nr:hypothetical protein [Ktedonobacterales bacterium]
MSRQRHNGKRSDARSGQRQRRQTSKSSQTSRTPKSSNATKAAKIATAQAADAPKKRPSAQSPQLTTPTPAPVAKPEKLAGRETADAAPKSTSKARTSAGAKNAAARQKHPTPEMAISEAAVRIEEPAPTPIAEMPEIPEPEVPKTPEIPEIPETPEIPEIPEIPETPEIPEVPETPVEPEVPEVPEVPEEPEQPQHPEEPPAPTVPEEPAEPGEPTEPDNPAVQAPADTRHNSGVAQPDEPEVPVAPDVPVVPIATERRMPTLAVMAKGRHEPSATADQGAAQAQGTPEAKLDTQAAHSADEARQHAGRTSSGVQAAASTSKQPRSAASSEAASQSASIVTRPVSARYINRRRKGAYTPDFDWESDPRLAYLPWPLRYRFSNRPQSSPSADWLSPVVVFHIFLMALLGLIGALQGFSSNNSLGTWILVGAIIAGAGGAVAYVFGEHESLWRFSPYVLVASQLGLLAWAMLLVGPRASLLALVPAFVEVALLMSGSLLASLVAMGALLVYAFFAGLSISVSMTPVSTPGATGAAVLDVICVVIGLLATLWLLLTIESGREHARAIARARRHEAEVLRRLVTQFRQETQDITAKLESALLQALKGQNIGTIPTEGMYRLLAETIMDTASRLEVLQRDREERLRLEGALRVAIRAVERQWLGVEPQWPDSTGTAVDELVALLRTPRLDETFEREAASPSITPRLIPIPTLTVERDTPPPAPISHPLSSASWLASQRRSRRPDLYPLPAASDDFIHTNEAD